MPKKPSAKSATLLFFFLFFSFNLIAQTKVVTGHISDNAGAPVAGVTVTVKGTKTSTQTDNNGDYRISVGENGTLQFSSVGFSTVSQSVAGKSTVNVTLNNQTSNLNEVVIVGYGTQRKKDITGSVTSVKSKDFNQGVITEPDQLLQGKVSGLEITSNSGQPGAATTMKIRGNNSIRAVNNPLYVIDGVPLDGRTAKPSLNLGTGSGLDFGTTPESNPLLYINPNDIAQIDVLKDASATAIYGSRAANGVIVITTKKATGASKIEFGSRFSVNTGYMKKFKILSADQFRSFTTANHLNYDSASSVDALKAITQSNISQDYNLALSGGNENAKFRASFLGSKNNGLIKKTSLEKYLGDFSGQYNFLDKKLSLDFNVIAGHTTEHMGLISNTAGAGGNLMSYALNWNPTKSFTDSRGLYNPASNSIPNPLAVISAYNDVADVNVFLANVAASFKLAHNLEYKFLYAINHGTGKRLTNFDGWIDGVKAVSGSGFAAISEAELTSQTFTHTLKYNASLSSSLKFDALGGYEYFKTAYSNSAVYANQFNTNLDQEHRVPVLYTSFMQNAKTQYPEVVSIDPRTELQSYFARLNFNLSDRYFLTSTIRADGSSKFGKNNKYGYFPSVGAKWLISNESFFKPGALLSNLGLRASWGITGNQEFPAGASLEQYNSGSYNGIAQSNVANPDLKWEKTTQIDVGLDFSILKNRIFGSVDYYNKNTTDLLFQSTAIQPAPATIFFINLPAHLMNSGIELSLGANVVSHNKFNWDLSLNVAHNKNMLKDFNQADIHTAQINGQGVSGVLAQVIGNNHPVNVFYLKQFNGYTKDSMQIIADNPSFQGDPNPKYIFGISNTLRYSKWSLTVNMSGASGFQIYNNTANVVTNIGNIQSGNNIGLASLTSGESIKDGVVASTRYLEKGDYLKLRNATLNYAAGDLGKYFKNVNIFVGGNNLFVLTKFTGFDPEVNVDKNQNNYPSRNIEYIPYPTPRTITFGFNMSL